MTHQTNSHTLLFSIIIPMYNVEKLILRCLESIYQQSYLNFQLLLIDDGSTDNTYSICKEYCYNKNVSLFQKSNGGVSSARNLGIKHAIGEYIFFLDADDFFTSSDSLLYISNFIEHNSKADIYQHKVMTIDKQNCQILKDYSFEGIVNTNQYSKLHILRGEVWNYVFKSQLLKENRILFLEGIRISEDQHFVYSSIKYCNTVGIINKAIYTYDKTNETSAIHKPISLNDIKSHIVVINELMKVCDKSSNNRHLIGERISMLIIHFLRLCLRLEKDREIPLEIESFFKRHVKYRKYLLGNNKTIIVLCSLQSPKLGILILKVLNLFHK